MALAEFVRYLGHDHIAIKSKKIGEKGQQEGHFKAIEINKAEDFITLRKGRQLWINLQRLTPEITREYINFADVAAYKNVYIDLDCEKPEGMKDYAATKEERATALLQLPILQAWLVTHGLKYGLELRTGNGCGMVLPIPETKPEPVFIAKLATFLKTVAAYIPSVDTAMFDPPRVIGIPGTLNAKLEKEGRKNQTRKVVGPIPERVEDPALLDFINTMQPDPAVLKTYQTKYNAPPDDAPRAEALAVEVEPVSEDAAERLQELFAADPMFKADLHTPVPTGKRSEAEFHLCARLWEAGFAEAEIYGIMTSSPQTKWLERGADSYRWDTIKKAVAKAEASHQENETDGISGHVIKVNDRGLNEVTRDALMALTACNNPPWIFSRTGSLVRLHRNEHYVIDPLTKYTLRYALAKSARFFTIRKGEKAITEVYPPDGLANNLIAADDWPGLPEIKSIIETPVIRPDGSMLLTPGYDEATRLYLDPIVDLSGLVIPETLTKKHAEASAKYILDEIFADFPFENDASRTNTLASLLSVIVRPMINGNIPLFILDKPQAGTGASLIADIIATITTGKPASMWGQPETEDEWRKAITSALLSGSPIIVIDNVVGMLRSAALSRALTSRIWRDRLLGKSQMLDLPQEAVWFATGNNIQIGGDTARRGVWIRLDAAEARPWTRTEFKHPNILKWIGENHDSIIAYLLIMARAWIQAGKPLGSAKLGGFNEWAEVISGILEFAEVKDFMGNATQLYDEMDQDVQQWDAFLKEWTKIYAGPISAGELRNNLISTAQVYRTFQESMPDDVANAVSKERRASLSLGVVLRKHLNQVYPSGRKLTQEKDTHTKSGMWKVCG